MKLIQVGVAAVALALGAAAQAAPAAAPAAPLAGVWRCQIEYNGAPIAVGIHFAQATDGKLTATADNPDPSAPPSSVQVTVDGDNVHLFVSDVDAGFAGKLNAAGDAIDGAWTVGDANLACVLKKDKP